MKKLLVIAAAVIAAASICACGSKKADDKTIKIGASPSPHAEILAQVKDDLAAKGYTLEIIEYTDYVQPNTALDSGELTANYFQHVPYLDEFNAEYGTKISSAAIIHYEPFGIYAGKTARIDALAEGAKIAVPNDVTNEARALLLLEQEGVIKLAEGAGLTATKQDIVENPLNVEIIEIEAAQVPRSLQDVDVAVVNGNYAIDAGLRVSDAIAIESTDSLAADTYGNIIAVQTGHENDDGIKALIEALETDKIRKFIEDKYEGAVVAKF